MSEFTGSVRTSAELEAILQEITGLSKSRMAPEPFLRRFLELSIYGVGAQGGVIWMLQGAEFQRVFSAGFEQTQFESHEQQRLAIEQALRDTIQDLRPLVIPPQGASSTSSPRFNSTNLPIFYVPVVRTEFIKTLPVFAVLQVWGRPDLDPRNYREVVGFLHSVAEQAALFLQFRRIESLASGQEKMQQQLKFVSELSAQTSLQGIATIVVNWGRELTGCDRCALLYRNRSGKLKPLAISHVEVIDDRSSLVQSQLALGKDVMVAGQATLFRKANLKSEESGDISDYFYHSHATEVFVLPVPRPGGGHLGLLLFEAHKDKPIDDATQKMALAIAAQAGRSMNVVEEFSSLPMISTLKGVRRIREQWTGEGRHKTWVRVGIPLLVILVLALIPWKLMVRGECSVMPLIRASATTEEGGRIVEVLVREGESVIARQVLARLDDTTLRQQLQVALTEKTKHEAEADRQQVLGDEGAKKVAMIEAERSGHEIKYLQRQLDRINIRSPIEGVILTPELQARRGEVLQTGSRFCEVGNLDRWQVSTRIKQSEIPLLDQQLRGGAPVEVRFRLHSFPDREWKVALKGANAISQLPDQNHTANVFLIKAEMPSSPELIAALKAGYTGRGSIHVGWRPGVVLFGRKLVNYLRVRWFV